MNRKFEFYCNHLKRTVTEEECSVTSEKIDSDECWECSALEKAAADVLLPLIKQELKENAGIKSYYNDEDGINVEIHDNLIISVFFSANEPEVDFIITNNSSIASGKYIFEAYAVERTKIVDEIKKWVNGEKVLILKKGLLGGSWSTTVVDRSDLRTNKEKLLKGFRVNVVDNTGIYTKKEYLGQ